MNYNYKIIEVALQHLSALQITALYDIFEQTQLHWEKDSSAGNGLADIVDYHAIQQYAVKNESAETGRVFFMQTLDTLEYIGFALCFDNVELKSQAFPLSFYRDIIVHDISFVEDLSHLGTFGFIFQLGIIPAHQRNGCGTAILKELEGFYQKNNTMILGISLHELQFPSIRILTKRPNYWILDQYFSDSSENTDQLRFRIVYLIHKKDFFETINATELPKTYKTVIPMQLYFAKNDVNRLIQNLGARIVWTSFFNDSHVLRKYKMSKHYNGSFESLLEVKEYEQFENLIPHVKKISNYLRQKDSNPNMASLTSFLNEKSFVLVFVNGAFESKDLTSFGTPHVFNLMDEDVLNKMDEALGVTPKRPLLNFQEQKEWRTLLGHKSRSNDLTQSNDSNGKIFSGKPSEYWENRWNYWKKSLMISEEEAQQLIEAQRIINENIGEYEKRTENKTLIKQKAAYINDILGRGKISMEFEKWETWVELHRELYDLDTRYLPDRNQYWWCHAVIPMGHTGGVSGIMFTFRFKKGDKPEQDAQRLNDLAQTISSALSKNMFNIITKLQHRAINEEAYRYAVAAISSRNLSHNLGSHVLSRLSSDENFKKHLDKDRIGDSVKHFTTLLSYLRSRMNLLADMSTTDPVASVGVMFNGEIIQYLKDQYILLHYISGTELNNIDIEYVNNIKGQEHKDVMVQSPNGELGFSAFAMIIENIIRNTAKHEQLSKDGLTITISIYRENARGYYIHVFDDVYRSKRDIDRLVNTINHNFIDSDIFSEGYTIRPSGWGIGEMKVAASYLRKKISDVHYEVEKKREISFLKAKRINKNTTDPKRKPDYGFAYELYLKKPREILIIEPKLDRDYAQNEELMRHGIKTISIEESKVSTEIHSHQLAVLTASGSKKEIEDKKRFPFRWVIMQEEDQRKALKAKFNEDIENTILWLWKKWIQAYLSRKNLAQNDFKTYVLLQNDSLKDLRKKCHLADEHPENAIIFDSHGTQLLDELLVNKNKYYFYESFTSISPTGTLLLNYSAPLNSEKKKELFDITLLEAAITQVMIIDERIQQEISYRKSTFLEGRMKKHTSFFEYLKGMNIHVPDSDQDPNLRFYEINLPDDLEVNLLNWIEAQMQQVKIDFVVFHIGLLEKLVSSHISDLEHWITEKIKRIDPRPEIIFISGRGKPHLMPNNISFQQYNNIARYVLDVPSKYHLCQMLFGARTTLLK